jgi:glycine betaine/proline transport system substrate-binding protein
MKILWLKTGWLVLLLLALALSGCGIQTHDGQTAESGKQAESAQDNTQQQPDKKDVTITFAVTPWTSTIPPTHVAKLLLEQMGYTVKLQDADAGVAFAGLSKGDIDVFMDSWLPDMHKDYMEKFGDQIDDVAVSYKEGELGWAIPTYVEGIESMADVKGREDEFDGKIYGIEEGAGMTMTSREAIKAYGLDLQYMASSESAMLAQVKKMIDSKKPVLFLGWRPHPMFVKWDLKILKDPKGFFKTQEVHVLTHKGFDQKAPEAYQFLKNWQIPIGDVEKMIMQIEEGADPAEVARQWIEENPDKVNHMLGK